MAERSSTPEPFDCKTPPSEIDETFPTLESAVFTLDPQNVEEDLEVINEHNLNSATFWRGVCLQYHQTFLEICPEVDEANILEEPLNAAKIEEKLLKLKPPQEIPHVLHIITQPKIPKEKESNERSAKNPNRANVSGILTDRSSSRIISADNTTTTRKGTNGYVTRNHQNNWSLFTY